MKKIFILMFLFSFPIFSQHIFFTEPTSSSVYESEGGSAAIAFSYYYSNYVINVIWIRAKLQYPDGSWSDWKYGSTGGWYVTKAGTYHIQAEANITHLYYGNIVVSREPFSFQVIDNEAPQHRKILIL